VEVPAVADNHFDLVIVWDNLGGAVRVNAGGRATVTDPATGDLVTVVQDGQSVTVVTADANGRTSFVAQQGVVKLTSGGLSMNAVSAEQATAGAANAAAAQDAQLAAESARDAAIAARDDTTTGLAGKVAKGDLVLNVKDYGATGDGTTNDTAAVNSAKAALGTKPGVIFFPVGDYVVDGLDFSMLANVELRGVASKVGGIYSNNSGNAASRLLSTATTGYGIKVDGGFGFTMRDLAIVATSSSFSGRLLDMREVAAITVTGLVTLDNCFIAGNATNRNGIGVDLDKTVTTKISRCTIVDFQYGVSGMGSSGSFSNVVTIEESYFQNNRTAHVHNPGQAWLLKNNTYEALSTGQAGAVAQDSGYTAEAITIEGGWLGDITSATASSHFNFAGTVYGLDISGAFIGGTSATTGLTVAAGTGVHVHGNSFHNVATAVSAAAAVTGIVGPNAYVGMTGVNVTATGMAVLDGASGTYTPTWAAATTAPAIGNGNLSAAWRRGPGNMIDAEISLFTGSTTTYGSGIYTLSLPTAARAGQSLVGEVIGFNSGVASQIGAAVLNGTSAVQVTFHGSGAAWSATGPWTFKSGDYVKVRLRYEAA
jgi:hypothetical protein